MRAAAMGTLEVGQYFSGNVARRGLEDLVEDRLEAMPGRELDDLGPIEWRVGGWVFAAGITRKKKGVGPRAQPLEFVTCLRGT